MRILLVNRFFGGSQTPTGRMLHDVAEELAAAKHEVIVLTSRGGYVGSEAALSASELPEFKIRLVWQSSAFPRLINWSWFWLNAVFRTPFMAWDRVVLMTDPPFLVFAAPMTKFMHGRTRRVLWWTMDLYPEALDAAGMLGRNRLPYRTLRQLTGWALRFVDGVIALGPRQLQRLQEYRSWRDTKGFGVVVPPWDDRPLPMPSAGDNPVVKRFGWEGFKMALYAGNLGEGHTFEEFIAAARSLHAAARTDWVFVFAVRGSRVAALKMQGADLPNVRILDYLPESETASLLWSATVHLISMKPGWEGVIVPSKLYGVLKTEAPVLFVGPNDADLVEEIGRLCRGKALSSGSSGIAVAAALHELASPAFKGIPVGTSKGARLVAELICNS